MPRVVRAQYVPDDVHRSVSRLFWVFGLLLASNVFVYWYLSSKGEPDYSKAGVYHAAVALTVVEVVDTVLILMAWLVCRDEIPEPKGIGTRPRLAWRLGLPVLAALLAANLGYHAFLFSLSGVQPETDGMIASGHYRIWLIALMSVQPAIIEELFFRRLVFDFFANSTTVGTAAFVSAMMFGAAHTGGLLSFPYLALFGFCMAWLRWFSGSLVLPIVLHGLHNFLISLYECDLL